MGVPQNHGITYLDDESCSPKVEDPLWPSWGMGEWWNPQLFSNPHPIPIHSQTNKSTMLGVFHEKKSGEPLKMTRSPISLY